MALRRFRSFIALAAVGAVALIGACSASVGPAPGAVMVSIDTNMKVPDDIDQVGITASLANVDGGTVWTDTVFDLKPASDAVFPATFAIVRGTDQPVAIRVVGYKDGTPLTLRDAIVTLPPDRTAVLRMPLDWLDKGSAVSASAGTTTKDETTADGGVVVVQDEAPAPSTLQSSCGAGRTSIAGACEAVVAQTSLPDFVAGDFPSSENLAACLNVDTCFPEFDTGVLDVAVDEASCSFKTTLAPTALNVAIRLGPLGNGWGNGFGHVMPIGQDPADGWHVAGDGSIVLPASICTNATGKILGVVATAASDTCPFKASNVPACQIYPDAGTTNPPPILDAGTDATVVARDGGDDDVDDGGAEAEAAAPIDRATHSIAVGTFSVLALTADDQRVYVLGGVNSTAGVIATAAALFDDGDTLATVPSPSGPYYAVMAAYDGHVGVCETEDCWTFDLIDGGTTNVHDPSITTNASTMIAFPSGSGATFVFGDVGDTMLHYASSDGDGGTGSAAVSALALDPATTTTGNPLVAAALVEGANGSPENVVRGALQLGGAAGIDTSTVTAKPTFPPAQLAFADEAHLVWTDTSNRVCYGGTTASTAAGTCFATDAGTLQGMVAGGDGAAFWIGPNNVVYQATFASGGGSGGVGTITIPALGSTATLLYIFGNQLYWTDGTRVYRRDVRSLL